MNQPSQRIAVTHNARLRRFESMTGGAMSLLAYLQSPGRIVFVHTEAPPELRGRGIASELARRALDYARREGLRVVAQCPFVAGYLRVHPEYADLVESM